MVSENSFCDVRVTSRSGTLFMLSDWQRKRRSSWMCWVCVTVRGRQYKDQQLSSPEYAACRFPIIGGIAGRSGLVVARLPAAREDPGSNRAADRSFCVSRKSLRYAALGTDCTLTAVPRSTTAFHSPRDGK